jgi:hypothetical protein
MQMFHAADDLNIRFSGHDGMSRLVECLQAAAAESIDGGSGHGGGQAGQEGDLPRDVGALGAGLLSGTE